MRHRQIGYWTGIVLLVAPAPVWADAATHSFAFTSISEMPADCANGQCATACVMHAKLTSLRGQSPPLSIRLVWPAEDRDEPTAQTAFDFPALAKGGSADTTAHELRQCKDIRVGKVEVACSEARDRCPGFVNVQMPDAPALSLKRQKVEGR